MTKLWSHAAAQRALKGAWGQASWLEVPGIGRGQYVPSSAGSYILDADPPGCEATLLKWARLEQEALSRRWGRSALVVLPLKEEAFALFGRDHQLRGIVFEQDGLAEAILAEARAQEAEEEARPAKRLESDLSLEDLGL